MSHQWVEEFHQGTFLVDRCSTCKAVRKVSQTQSGPSPGTEYFNAEGILWENEPPCKTKELGPGIRRAIHPATRPVVNTLVWLLDPNTYRGEGRSTMMALAFIQIAKSRVGTWVDVFDHVLDPGSGNLNRNREEMLRRIRGMFDADPVLFGLENEVIIEPGSFRFKLVHRQAP